jgi:hypothetical protein
MMRFILFIHVGDVSMLRQLHEQRQQSAADPVFRYAAYRAMDQLLARLQVTGTAADLRNLRAFLGELDDFQAENKACRAARERQVGDHQQRRALRLDQHCDDGVYTRTQWTVNKLAEAMQ